MSFSASALGFLLATSASEPAVLAPKTSDFDSVVRPFLAQHCFYCHGETRQKAGIAFTEYPDEAHALADRDVWGLVREQLAHDEMPPEERPRPAHADVLAVIAWIDSKLGSSPVRPAEMPSGVVPSTPALGPKVAPGASASSGAIEAPGTIAATGSSAATGSTHAIDPGRVTLRRLNRTQYANTIRDLVGVDFDAAREFPSDDVGYGFDDIGDVLSMPDILMEKYLAAAEKIAAAAIRVEDPEHPLVVRLTAGQLEGTKGSGLRGVDHVLFSVSEVATAHRFQRDGEYVLRASAYGDQAGPDPARMAFRIDGHDVARFDVKAVAAAPELYEARVRVAVGLRRVAVAFTNDYYKADDPDPKNRDRNLIVRSLEIVGPVDAPVLSAFQRRYLPSIQARSNAASQSSSTASQSSGAASPSTEVIVSAAERAVLRRRASEILAQVALHAYRRPPTGAEIERLIALSPPDATLAECVRTALKALLVSPHFLFLVERDPATGGARSINDRELAVSDATHAISDWELASRLSYFLWSSMPDDELLMRAEEGRLHDARVLDDEVARMLRDARSSALTRDFADQWLQVRNLDRAAPDPAHFPAFDDELRAAMKAETEMFFDAIAREDRSVWSLVDSDFTFVNERLARHYGIPGVHGPEMRRIHLQGGPRGGVLTQASVLTITSNPTRTSPVKRGKWILETLIGKPTPPPPPGVGVLDESHVASGEVSLRVRLEEHRKNPDCAVCHARLDPLGFGLENFDAIGAWRERDGAFAVDASGKLADGRDFRGPNELKQILATDDGFVRCLTRKLATYALGRGLTPADEPSIDALVRSLASKRPTLGDIITGIVHTDAFQKRRAEKAGS